MGRDEGFLRLYRAASLVALAGFAGVGLAFLFMPDQALAGLNGLGERLGLPAGPVQGRDLYLSLAVGYMYVVALLAWLMFRNPRVAMFPLLLTHAKLATSALSFYLAVSDAPYMMYLANGVGDGLIGLAALAFYLRVRRLA